MDNRAVRLLALMTANGAVLLYLIQGIDAGLIIPVREFEHPERFRFGALAPMIGLVAAYFGLAAPPNSRLSQGLEAVACGIFFTCVFIWMLREYSIPQA